MYQENVEESRRLRGSKLQNKKKGLNLPFPTGLLSICCGDRSIISLPNSRSTRWSVRVPISDVKGFLFCFKGHVRVKLDCCPSVP